MGENGASSNENGAANPFTDELLSSYPNLRKLEPICYECDWPTTEVPNLGKKVTHGVLQNGMAYYVQENREPKTRAELYLIVGFGSLVEEENERGIAHIIEHLGFSATKAYENHAIVKFLESIGAPFGACQNAYTSFDRTVYTLHIPSDKPEIITESLTVLREFAYYTRISPEDLDKERKVVLEEWRESRNAQGRLFEEYICALTKGCKYCERLPIGKEEVIRNVSAETLQGFYQKYYHPGRMALVAIGDFEGDTILRSIKELFDIAPESISPLPRTPTPPERPWYEVPDTEGVEVASSTDAELSFAQVMMDCKRPRQRLKNLSDYKRRFTEELFHKALSSRLLKLVMEPRGPRNFLSVTTQNAEPIPCLDPMNAGIAPLPGRAVPAFKETLREIHRVKQHGFHDSEISRAKRAMLAEFEEQLIQQDQTPSEGLCDEYVNNFLDDRPAPGIEYCARIAATVLPAITASEVSQVSSEFRLDKNVVVKICTPPLSIWNPLYTCWSFLQAVWHCTLPRPRADLPNSSEVKQFFLDAAEENVDPQPPDVDDVDSRLQRQFVACANKRSTKDATLENAAPSSRDIVAEGVARPTRRSAEAKTVEGSSNGTLENDALLGKEVVLSNGLRLFLKHTDLFDDEILLRARRWGGLSEHQGQGLVARGVVSTEAQIASMSALMLGICGLSVESLQECLDGKRLQPSPPDLDAYSTAFDAKTSPVDLETLLTLVHLMFQCPVDPCEKSRGRLTLVKLGLLAWRLAANRDPASQFEKRVLKVISENHPYHSLPSIWSILRLNFEKSCAVFNERTSQPCEWTFVLVGKLPAESTLVPLLDKYLGSIPNRQPGPACSLPADASGASLRRSDVQGREAITPLNITFPNKDIREEVKLHMIDPKGKTLLCYPLNLESKTKEGDLKSADDELQQMFLVKFLARMLETRLVEVLRFKLGKVYNVHVGDDFTLSSPRLGSMRQGTMSISFECDPAEADELVDATREVLQKIRDGTEGFTAENVTALREKERRELEEALLKNDFWADTIMELYFSRIHVAAGNIGSTLAFWWRVRDRVLDALDEKAASEGLRSLIPEGGTSALITMRPKVSLWKRFTKLPTLFRQWYAKLWPKGKSE